jgi:hypothetical protein
MLEQVFFSAFAHTVDHPNPHSQGTTPLQTSRQHRIFTVSHEPVSQNGSTGELRPEASALLRHEPDRPTSVPGLLRPTRYPDSLVKQCLHQWPRIQSAPLARLPLPRTVPRRSRRGRLEGTQFRSSSYERSAANTIRRHLYHFPIDLRSSQHNTPTTLRGNGHIGLRV